jgi:hypothetical protein
MGTYLCVGFLALFEKRSRIKITKQGVLELGLEAGEEAQRAE